MKSYKVIFHGAPEVVNAMTRQFDKVFRMYYNVYGGKLVDSFRGVEGEQVMVMEYAAYWCINYWPCFERLRELADRRLNRQNIRWSEKPYDGGAWFEYID